MTTQFQTDSLSLSELIKRSSLATFLLNNNITISTCAPTLRILSKFDALLSLPTASPVLDSVITHGVTVALSSGNLMIDHDTKWQLNPIPAPLNAKILQALRKDGDEVSISLFLLVNSTT